MRLAPAIALTATAMFALAACQPDAAPIVPTPAPSTSPIFASDEEALAAAADAFSAYLLALDDIRHGGGADVERLNGVATADVVNHEASGLAEMKANGERSTGYTHFDSISLQNRTIDAASTQNIVIVYLCEDFSDTDVVGKDGKSLISESRQTRWPLEVSFDGTGAADMPLIVSAVEDWTGADFCQL
jgi:hypothetical protein